MTCSQATCAARTNSLETEDELQLVKQAQRGDGGAFARLLEPHILEAYHIALRITRNREDAEDASQQSFLNAYEHIDQFRGQSRFSTWLMRIAMNEALGKVREAPLRGSPPAVSRERRRRAEHNRNAAGQRLAAS